MNSCSLENYMENSALINKVCATKIIKENQILILRIGREKYIITSPFNEEIRIHFKCKTEKNSKFAYIKGSSIVELPEECSLTAEMLKINRIYRGQITKEMAPSNISIISLKVNLSVAGTENEWDNEFEDLISIYFQNNSKTQIDIAERRKMHISLRDERGIKIDNYWKFILKTFNPFICLLGLVSIGIIFKTMVRL
jgi:AAA15 family ATPase/GTPase